MSESMEALRRSLASLEGHYARALAEASTEQEMEAAHNKYASRIAALQSKVTGIPLSMGDKDLPFAEKSRTGKIIDVFKAVAKEFNLEEGEIDEVITNDYDFISATLKNMYDQILENDFNNMPEEVRQYMVENLDFVPFEKREVKEDIEGDRLKTATLEDCLAIALTTRFMGSLTASSLKAEACTLYQDIHHKAPKNIDSIVNKFIKLMTHPNVNILTYTSADTYEINLNAKVN